MLSTWLLVRRAQCAERRAAAIETVNAVYQARHEAGLAAEKARAAAIEAGLAAEKARAAATAAGVAAEKAQAAATAASEVALAAMQAEIERLRAQNRQ